jgi:hypothetical protein
MHTHRIAPNRRPTEPALSLIREGTSREDHDLVIDLADRERAVCRVAGLEDFGRDESWRSYRPRPVGCLKLG